MIRFVFKTAVFLVILGAVLATMCQRRAAAPRVQEGPAEKAGAVTDQVLHGVGKATEKAGEQLQNLTERRSAGDSTAGGTVASSADTISDVPLKAATPTDALTPTGRMGDEGERTAPAPRGENALDELNHQLDEERAAPPGPPAPAAPQPHASPIPIEEF